MKRTLSRKDVNTLGLSALGGALEYYDFIIFVFLAASIGQLFFPPDMPVWMKQLQVFGIFAAGYLARPIGGLLMAHFGDVIGRKRMFTFSLFLMAVPTFIMGLLPTYAQIGIAAPILLLLMRMLQGAAVGGEIPGACVFVTEHVPKNHIGLASGTLFSGFTTGILLGSLVAMAVNAFFPAQAVLDYAWRIPFLLGGVFGVFALYLRRWLEETPVFLAMKEQKALAAELPLKMVLRDHKAQIWPAMLLTWFLSAGIVTITLLTPNIMETQHHYDRGEALLANSIAIVFSDLGLYFLGLAGRPHRFVSGIVDRGLGTCCQQLCVLPRTACRCPAHHCAVFADRFCAGFGCSGADDPGRSVSTGGALLGVFVFLQRGVLDFRRLHAHPDRAMAESRYLGAGALPGNGMCGGFHALFLAR